MYSFIHRISSLLQLHSVSAYIHCTHDTIGLRPNYLSPIRLQPLDVHVHVHAHIHVHVVCLGKHKYHAMVQVSTERERQTDRERQRERSSLYDKRLCGCSLNRIPLIRGQ